MFKSNRSTIASIYGIIMIIVLSMMIATAANAQTFEYAKSSTGFDVTSGVDTETVFTCDGKTFPLFKTAKGAQYVKGISAKNTEYPIWIGSETSVMHDGKRVYKFNSGKYAVFTLSNKGFPRAQYLEPK